MNPSNSTTRGRRIAISLWSILFVMGYFMFEPYPTVRLHKIVHLDFYEERLGRSALERTPKNGNRSYIVNTPNCRIMNVKPWDPALRKHYKAKGHAQCKKGLVQLVGKRHLTYDETSPPHPNLTCCYRTFERPPKETKNYSSIADDRIKFSKSCLPIPGDIEPENTEFVQIKCRRKRKSGRMVRTKDYHALVPPPSVHTDLTKLKTLHWETFSKSQESRDKKAALPPSVLVLALDSVSRLNSIRILPKTRKFLEAHDFVEMKGYTKVGINTFPNFMALFLGDPRYFGGVECLKWKKGEERDANSCPYIWQNFSRNNYVTAFSEDWSRMALLNLAGVGFVDPPTDYYYRPFTLAYHPQKCVSGLSVTQYMLGYVREFVGTMGAARVPYFMVAWFIRGGHNLLNGWKAYDRDLKDAVSRATLGPEGNNTVVLVIGDHGQNFGNFRQTSQGYFETALPLMFLRLPPSLKESHPHWYRNLKERSEQLSSPLDVHATLQDILGLSSPKDSSSSPLDSSSSDWKSIYGREIHSLFEEAPLNRTCNATGIPEKYCRCGLDPAFSKNVHNPPDILRETILSSVNEILQNATDDELCAPLTFRRYMHVRQLRMGEVVDGAGRSKRYKQYLVALEVSPSDAHFEALLNHFEEDDETQMVSEIRRINRFQHQADCLEHSDPRLYYCLCK